jgi:hypothetical protein
MPSTILATITDDARMFWPMFFLRNWNGRPPTASPSAIVPGATTNPGYAWNPMITHFRVGEGGWVDPGTGAVRRDPDSTLRSFSHVDDYAGASYYLQDLDIAVDPTRSTPTKRYNIVDPTHASWFEKALSNTDFTWFAANTVQVRCVLETTEYNANGSGINPKIWEIGLYCDHPLVPMDTTPPCNTGLNANFRRLLVAYGTFPIEVKDSSKQIEHLVNITF